MNDERFSEIWDKFNRDIWNIANDMSYTSNNASVTGISRNWVVDNTTTTKIGNQYIEAKKSEIEWTIHKDTNALIAPQNRFQYGLNEWSVIKTTHENHFTQFDEFAPNLADWFVAELVVKINALPPQVKFFVKENWIICCKI